MHENETCTVLVGLLQTYFARIVDWFLRAVRKNLFAVDNNRIDNARTRLENPLLLPSQRPTCADLSGKHE